LAVQTLTVFFALTALLIAGGCGGDGNASANQPAAADGSNGQDASPRGQSEPGAANQLAVDSTHPVVTIDTSEGAITVELDAEKAPLTVDNFLSYVEAGHYDQTIFHQVLSDYPQLILGGAYTSEKVEKTTHTPIRNEAHNGLRNTRGAIAMARRADAIDSATCHFFINRSDNEVLDHKDRTLEGYGYCVFGKVIDGLEVVDKIGAVDVQDTETFERVPVETVRINSVRRVR
jgi:peptidyl-prolyl cis-trans isomerase B (cyclophilin B)